MRRPVIAFCLTTACSTLSGCSVDIGTTPKPSLTDQAKLAYSQQKLLEAEPLYTSALADGNYKDIADLYCERGYCRASLNKIAGAKEDFLKCIELDPKTYNHLYIDIASLDFFDGAYLAGLNHLALASDDLRIVARKKAVQSSLLFALRRFPDAIAAAKESLRICNDSSECTKTAQFIYASALENNGEHDKALKELSEIRKKFVVAKRPYELKTFAVGKTFKFAVQSKHFIVYSQKSDEYCNEIAGKLEKFLTWFSNEYLEVPQNFALILFIADSPKEQEHLVKWVFNGVPATDKSGQYFEGYNCILSNQNQDFDVLINEVTKGLLFSLTPGIEMWAREGVPALIESMYKDHSSTKLNIVTPSSNPRVTVKAFDRATTFDLKAVCVNSSKFTQDLEADRLVAAFLYQNGFLKKYLRIAAALDPAGPFVNCLEDATGKSFNELQPMWKNFLVGAHGITLEGARRTK